MPTIIITPNITIANLSDHAEPDVSDFANGIDTGVEFGEAVSVVWSVGGVVTAGAAVVAGGAVVVVGVASTCPEIPKTLRPGEVTE